MRINSCSSVRCHWLETVMYFQLRESRKRNLDVKCGNVVLSGLLFRNFVHPNFSMGRRKWQGCESPLQQWEFQNTHRTPRHDSRSKSFSLPVRKSQRFLEYKAAKCLHLNNMVFVCFVFYFPSTVIKSLKSIFHVAFYSVYTDTQK